MSAPLFGRLQNPFIKGIRGAMKGFGDRAARNMYGEHEGDLREHVWKDLLGGIANSFAGEDVLAPFQERLERERRIAQQDRLKGWRDSQQRPMEPIAPTPAPPTTLPYHNKLLHRRT